MALLNNKTVVSGKDVQKTGFEAFILISFVDWRNISPVSEGRPIDRWYNKVVEQVWASFVAGGMPIKKCTTVVELGHMAVACARKGWKAPGDVAIYPSKHYELSTWITRYLPTQYPIIVALVGDHIDSLGYLRSYASRPNIVKFHELRYDRASTSIGEMEAYLQELEHIYSNDPEGCFYSRESQVDIPLKARMRQLALRADAEI